MSTATLYYKEARYDLLSIVRAPAFVLPALAFPLMFYLFFGVFFRAGAGVEEFRGVAAEDGPVAVAQEGDAAGQRGQCQSVRADEHLALAEAGDQFTVIGEAGAGHGFAGSLAPQDATRIFTGAPLPTGAVTIAVQEDVTANGQSITVNTATAGRPHGPSP